MQFEVDIVIGILPYIDYKELRSQLGNSIKLKKLLDLLTNGENYEDKLAYEAIFNGRPNPDALKQLKLRLRERVFKYLLTNGARFKNLDDYSENYRKLLSYCTIIKLFATNNLRNEATKIAENILKGALESEYTDVVIFLARHLTYDYSSIKLDKRKYAKYSDILLKYKGILDKEIELQQYANELRFTYETSYTKNTDAILTKAIMYYDIAKEYSQLDNVSYELLLNAYIIRVMRYEITHDVANLYIECTNAIECFENRKVSRKVALFIFDIKRIACAIQLREYEKAEDLIEKYLKQVTIGSINWNVLKMYLVLTNLRSEEYLKAFANTIDGTNDPKFKRLPESKKELWHIYRAYVEFAMEINEINTYKRGQFRLGKFLNQTPIYAKDKRRLNIAILVIQFMFLLKQRKYAELIDKMESLRQYSYRYLKRDSTFRSNCFIQMLIQIPKAGFNKRRTERYAASYLKKLRKMPLGITEESFEVEIIPYERLWYMATELLN